MDPPIDDDPAVDPRQSPATLTAAVLAEEAEREATQARASEAVIFPDDLLPGVDSAPVSFHDAFARAGA